MYGLSEQATLHIFAAGMAGAMAAYVVYDLLKVVVSEVLYWGMRAAEWAYAQLKARY